MSINPAKAYDNKEFLNGHDARSIRVLCELLEPDVRLSKQGINNTIVFFGSARSKSTGKAKAELSDFSSQLPPNKERTEEQIAVVEKLEAIARLSQYYDNAVELSHKLTKWSENNPPENKYYVCSGGGPGMMEAANKGARDAGGKSIALGISLPFEQGINDFADPELSFEFHYFFLRKFYFLYHAKAIVVFPGGFGTMDELFETLTLTQTNKMLKQIPVFLYGKEFWDGLINFEHFVKWGVISRGDLDLFQIVDNVDDAFTRITSSLRPMMG
ncbi:MAG: LOG family protein [Opitutae bacterium]